MLSFKKFEQNKFFKSHLTMAVSSGKLKPVLRLGEANHAVSLQIKSQEGICRKAKKNEGVEKGAKKKPPPKRGLDKYVKAESVRLA